MFRKDKKKQNKMALVNFLQMNDQDLFDIKECFDLERDLLNSYDCLLGNSIHSDCKYFEKASEPLFTDFNDILCPEFKSDLVKPELIHHDCMWSGRCRTDIPNSKALHLLSKIPKSGQQQQQTTTQQQHQQIQQQMNTVSMIDLQIKDMPKGVIQNIPPGGSLLLNSRFNNNNSNNTNTNNNNNQKKQQYKMTIPTVMPTDFLKEREAIITRPDTPLSLDEDPPEFKHSINLAACVTGSNNICLDPTTQSEMEKRTIKLLQAQLEDNTLPGGKMLFSKDLSTDDKHDLADVMNIIKAEIDDKSDIESEYEDSMSSSTEYNSPSRYSHPVMHSDHSYTRSKNGVDVMGLGIETPSDSDEEIDVVSVGDKKLPTNPSDKDRRALQTNFANKFTSRIVKTQSGLKTIPPRRRCSPEPLTSTKSSSYSPYSSPTSSYASSVSSSSKYSTNSRKRNYNSSKDDYTPSNKRSRGKKQRSPNKRHSSYDPDEADTIEKRNLHNDMERQRRIGLKNLFEALKRQIPSIKDKDRAPKVNILREAAKLCEQFTREEKHINTTKQQLHIELQRRQARLRYLQSSMHR